MSSVLARIRDVASLYHIRVAERPSADIRRHPHYAPFSVHQTSYALEEGVVYVSEDACDIGHAGVIHEIGHLVFDVAQFGEEDGLWKTSEGDWVSWEILFALRAQCIPEWCSQMWYYNDEEGEEFGEKTPEERVRWLWGCSKEFRSSSVRSWGGVLVDDDLTPAWGQILMAPLKKTQCEGCAR